MKAGIKLHSSFFSVINLPVLSASRPSLRRIGAALDVDVPCFSDEATFHVCGTVNRESCRVWGIENPCDVTGHEHDSPKVIVWCALI